MAAEAERIWRELDQTARELRAEVRAAVASLQEVTNRLLERDAQQELRLAKLEQMAKSAGGKAGRYQSALVLGITIALMIAARLLGIEVPK